MQEQKKIRLLTKDSLYKKTGWFSKDCEELINNLMECGLGIVNINDVAVVNTYLDSMEDDLK